MAEQRFIYFFLPPYSPHLNIIERLWKEMKQAWIKPNDYSSADQLFHAVDRVCAAIGNRLFLNFSKSHFQLFFILSHYLLIKTNIMLKKLSKTDIIMLLLAIMSLIFSETMWFSGEREGAIFLGLWVPSILGFAIYLKLIKSENK